MLLTLVNADLQTRGGYFGLLGVNEKHRAALEVELQDLGAARAPGAVN
jgi:hypothetical protein